MAKKINSFICVALSKTKFQSWWDRWEQERKKINCWGTVRQTKFIKDLDKSSGFGDFFVDHIELCFSITFKCVGKIFVSYASCFCIGLYVYLLCSQNVKLFYIQNMCQYKNMKLNTWSGVETYIDVLFRHYTALKTRKSGEKSKEKIFSEFISVFS